MNENQKHCCLFPQIQSSHHKHYATVHLTSLRIESKEENIFEINSNSNQWNICRSKQEFKEFDSLIHSCLVEKDFSCLPSPEERDSYLKRLNEILNDLRALSALKCLLILNWLECDNNGRHLIDPQDWDINQRSIGAALVIREFNEENSDKYLNLKSEELVSVLEINGFWTKGKKGLQVGLFPSECVRIIDESVVKRFARRQQLRDSPLVIRRFQRISSLFHFQTKHQKTSSKRIVEPRVFGRDLSEQLFDSNLEIPSVLSICSQFIESHGLLDGIYRLSGISSNISKLKEEFDSGLVPDFESVFNDIHSISSCLKLYFRLLPNPLLTFESYDEFVHCLRDDTLDDKTRLKTIRFLVRRLPPPHYRTVRALMRHLRRVSLSSSTTGMTEKNLSIVWAPNLLRSRDIENSIGGDLAALQVIGIQAVLTEFLINKYSLIFEETTEQLTTDLTTNIEFGSFGKRWKSFESFFSKKDLFFSEFRLNFAKIQTIIDLIHVLPEFERKVCPTVAVWKTTETQSCRPIVTTTPTTSNSIEIKSVCLLNDAIVVRQTSRERIERIKAQRRQQLKEQFSEKPIPTPRSRQILLKPIPKERTQKKEEIHILMTKYKPIKK